MTLKELKYELSKLILLKQKLSSIYNDTNLSTSQINEKAKKSKGLIKFIELKLKNYQEIFNVEAKTLEKYIEYVLSQNISESEIFCQHVCTGKDYKLEYFEGTVTSFKGISCIKTKINRFGKTQIITLFKQPVANNLNDDVDFILGNYNINCYNTLTNIDIKFSQLFHKACWLAIEETLIMKNKQIQKQLDKKEKLINRNIKELQTQTDIINIKSKQIELDNTTILSDQEIYELNKNI